MERKSKNGQAQIDLWKAFDQERARALSFHLQKKGLSLEQELLGYMEVLYKRHVPKTVREFLDSTSEKPAAMEEDAAESLPGNENHE